MADQPKKGRRNPPPKIDFELLTEADKQRLQEEALATARAERKAAAEAEYKRIALQEARRDEGIEEEMLTFTLDLAEYADRVVIDGFTYFHGRSYTVPRSTYQTLTEQAFRTHEHQHEIDGKSMKSWRGFDDPRGKPVQMSMSTGAVSHGVVNTTKSLRG